MQAPQCEFSIAEQIQEDGYLILPNFFTDAELFPVWSAIDRLAASFAKGLGLDASFINDVPATERDRMLVQLLKHHPALQSVLYDRLQQVPEILALPCHPKLLTLAHQLHQTDRVGIWPRLQVRLDLHNDDRNVIGWHHDYLYNGGTSASYTFWMPLASVVKEMGTLLFAKGSHQINDFPFEKLETGRRFTYSLSPEVLDSLDIIQPDSFSAGDLVIFHSRHVHSGCLNQLADRARLTLLYRMQNLETLEAFQS